MVGRASSSTAACSSKSADLDTVVRTVSAIVFARPQADTSTTLATCSRSLSPGTGSNLTSSSVSLLLKPPRSPSDPAWCVL